MKQIIGFLKDVTVDKKEARKFGISAGIILAMLFFYILFFLKPALVKLYTVIPEVKSIRVNIDKANADQQKEEQFKQRLTDLKDALKNTRLRLPAEKEVPALLEYLSSLAKKSNVKILGITPGSVVKPPVSGKKSAAATGTYQEVPILIHASAGYHDLGKFINDLENLDRFMQVSEIKIETDKKNLRRHNIELTLSTYILLYR